MHHVAAFLIAGLSAEEIASETLPRIPPAAIYEAVAYFYDHQSEIEAEWAANTHEAALSDLRQRLSSEQFISLTGGYGLRIDELPYTAATRRSCESDSPCPVP